MKNDWRLASYKDENTRNIRETDTIEMTQVWTWEYDT